MFWPSDNKLSKHVPEMFLNCLGLRGSSSTHITDTSSSQYPTVIEELCRQFSLADLRKSTYNFDQNRVIGSGGFGIVYKGCLQLQRNDASECTVVAVKRFNEQGWEAFKKEIELLCQLRHPNIVSLTGFCNLREEKILVYEYMSNGSLHQLLQRRKLSWNERLKICIGVARGLHYLHTGAKRSIFHCILCPSTILLDEHMEPKLSGFGASEQGSRFMSKTKQIRVKLVTGTLPYMAMEYAINGTVTEKCDVFSFGMVLLEIVCRKKYLTMPIEFLERPVEENIDPSIKGKIAPECWQVFIDIAQR